MSCITQPEASKPWLPAILTIVVCGILAPLSGGILMAPVIGIEDFEMFLKSLFFSYLFAGLPALLSGLFLAISGWRTGKPRPIVAVITSISSFAFIRILVITAEWWFIACLFVNSIATGLTCWLAVKPLWRGR